MEVFVDHYAVLGLPFSGQEFSEPEINRAYRTKARELHPDKSPNDPNAHANFLKLQNSYSTLKNPTTRKAFHDLMRAKRDKRDSKRRKMVVDLEKRERCSGVYYSNEKARELEITLRVLQEEIEGIRALHAKKTADPSKPAENIESERVRRVFDVYDHEQFEISVLEKMLRRRR